MSEPVDLRQLEVLGYMRHQERLHQATMWRPVSESRPPGTRFGRLFCQSMAWLGRRLATWGWSLQKRFDQATPASVL